MLPLSALGQRIIILGPSNSGKSTLAVSIARKQAMIAVHLDQLRQIPNTNWQERPDADFAQLHNAAIQKDSWVMDGNYSSLMPQRVERATGLIALNSNVWLRYFRYVKRTLRNNEARAGHLEGGEDQLSWKMTRWIMQTRNNGVRFARILQNTGKPSVACNTAKELRALYKNWSLPAP